MRVKVGDKWYDSTVEPILVEFVPEEKELIKNMPSIDNVFCAYPDELPVEEACAFMGTTVDNLTTYSLDGKAQV